MLGYGRIRGSKFGLSRRPNRSLLAQAEMNAGEADSAVDRRTDVGTALVEVPTPIDRR